MKVKPIWLPNPGPQTFFLQSDVREVMYGGAAGGGKSDALVILPLRWVHNSNHRVIYLRRTRPQLQETIDRMNEVYKRIEPDAQWRESRLRWEWPSGAIIQLGHAELERDILKYKSFQYNLVIFDELTSFYESQYKFMFSRNRTADPNLPLLMRSGTNPGDIGHEWVFKRFIDRKVPYRVYNDSFEIKSPKGKIIKIDFESQFVPATVFDNPMISDLDGYIAGMANMGEDAMRAMLYGDWTLFEGQFFHKLPEKVEPGLKDSLHYTIRCMDYGWVDPTAVYWIVVYPNLHTLEVVAELYVSKVTVDDTARMIKRVEDRLEREHSIAKPRYKVADPSMFKSEGIAAGQNVNTLLGRHGVWHQKANNDRVAGWAMLRLLIERDQLKVWQNVAPQLYATMPTLQYNPHNPDDIKSGGADHAVDALRYGTLAYFEYTPNIVEKIVKNPEQQDIYFDKLIASMRSKHNYVPQLGKF